MTPYDAMKLGEIIARDPLEMIATNAAERETDEDKRRQWKEWAKKLQGMAAVLLLSASLSPPDSKAASGQTFSALNPTNLYYVK